MQSTELRHQVFARAQVQVIGVGEDHRRSHRLQITRKDAFDRAFGAHGHEGRRFHRTMWSQEASAPRA